MKTRYSPKMSPKLEAVLTRLCERLGPVTKTRAVKLPYLVDVVAEHALGRPIAQGRYQTWDHGVVTREIYSFMTHTDGDDTLLVEDHDFSESGRQVRVRPKKHTKSHPPDPETSLAEDEMRIVDFVADRYGRLDAGRLGLLTKALNTHLDADVWGSNQQPATDEDAYARLNEGWVSLFERLPGLDLTDETQTRPVGDPRSHLKNMLRA